MFSLPTNSTCSTVCRCEENDALSHGACDHKAFGRLYDTTLYEILNHRLDTQHVRC